MDPVTLRNPPIIEAVLDIECELPPGLDLAALEQAAHGRFADRYPRLRRQLTAEFDLDVRSGEPAAAARPASLQALQFFQEDERQLVQVRREGYSFNRLAPYKSLDAYLPEIERTWKLYCGVAAPVRVLSVRLRYINRILLPATDGLVDLDRYLKVGPRLPAVGDLLLGEFLHQHVAYERQTGNRVSILLQGQPGAGDSLPVIFDITASVPGSGEAEDWSWIHSRIQSARRLKNLVFENTLTAKCLQLFQPI